MDLSKQIYDELRNGSKELYPESIYVLHNGTERGGYFQDRYIKALIDIPYSKKVLTYDIDDADCNTAIFANFHMREVGISAIIKSVARLFDEEEFNLEDRKEILAAIRSYFPNEVQHEKVTKNKMYLFRNADVKLEWES